VRSLSEFNHQPVLLQKCLDNLKIMPNGIYVDGTLGGGGHASAIASKLDSSGLLIGIDRDGDAIAAAEKRLTGNFTLVRDKHENIREVLNQLNIKVVNGFLLDLGVSSYQLDTPERGFSYRFDAPLDMRMDDRAEFSAYDIVNDWPENELVCILKEYGEERYAKRIARAICKMRPIKTTFELVDIIVNSTPYLKHGHPAARTFQAIRIAVNRELEDLAQTIEDMLDFLKPGGRICIITFHSLEDRIVKQSFKYLSNPCDCPRDIPYCVCGKKPSVRIISKKPILPDDTELANNPRSHSAKLRVAEKLKEE